MHRLILSAGLVLILATAPSFGQDAATEEQMSAACANYAKSQSWYRGHAITVTSNGAFGAGIYSFKVIATKDETKEFRCIYKQDGDVVASFDPQ